MKNKTIKRRIASLILSFLMIFNLISPNTNFNYNNEVVAEKSIIEEEKKQDKDNIKKKIENKKLENGNKISEDSDKIKKEESSKEHKKIELKKEKVAESLNGTEKKKDKVEIGDKQLEFEKSDKNSDELNKIKREGAILRGVPKERDKVEIKNIKIINYSNQEVIPGINALRSDEYFKMKFDFDASKYQNELKEGDYFIVKLPDQFKFSYNPMTITVTLKTEDGTDDLAEAFIISKGKEGGGEIKIVFKKYVENKYNIKGSMFLEASFVRKKVVENQINDFQISVGSDIKHIKIKILPPKPLNGEVFQKWGEAVIDENTNEIKARWCMRINHKKGTLKNVVITDKEEIFSGTPTGSFRLKYYPDSFELYKIAMDEYGRLDWNTAQKVPEAELNSKLSFNADKTAFELRLGDINGEQYYFQYYSTYQVGLKLKNKAVLKAQNIEQITLERYYQYNQAGGEGVGDNLGKIKIVKVSSEDPNLKLKGAKFKITKKATGETFELVTDDNGEAVSELLVPGEYDIQEVEPPKGFLLNGTTYTVIVKKGEVIVKTITNVPKKTSVKVTKTWIGPAKQVTIKLFKTVGGVKTEIQSKVLNETTGWTHTFTNLPKYENGVEIEYSVDEEVIAGYQKEIKKNAENDYTITNKNVEEVEVKVKKEWIGPSVSEITVNLLANGVKIQSQKLNKDNNWSHTFTDLPKYEGVNEIVYTIEEVKVDGYGSQIIKNGKNDYTIVNKNNEKTEINVEKQWIGPAVSEITVNLLANGKLKESVKLNKGNNWKHTFKNLNVYENGTEVVYTIEEVKIEGYESKLIKKNENSFTIVNINKATIEIPVIKKWVGASVSEITVNLLANGKLKESVKLNKGNNWKHTFKDLPKYDETTGVEIIYSISENALEGYETLITGSMKEGFTIVNTITGKLSIGVTKTWIGREADSVIINLLANGVKVQSQKLSKHNNWQHVFPDLEKYKDGVEIVYTIEEETLEGYRSKIKGDMNTGFTVTNIEKPKKPNKSPETKPKSKKTNPKTGDSMNISYMNLTTPYILKAFNFKKDKDESDE